MVSILTDKEGNTHRKQRSDWAAGSTWSDRRVFSGRQRVWVTGGHMLVEQVGCSFPVENDGRVVAPRHNAAKLHRHGSPARILDFYLNVLAYRL